MLYPSETVPGRRKNLVKPSTPARTASKNVRRSASCPRSVTTPEVQVPVKGMYPMKWPPVWEGAQSDTEAVLAALASVPGLALVASIRGAQSPGGLDWGDRRIKVTPLEVLSKTAPIPRRV